MTTKNKEIYDLIIIGAGIAGMTAAVYASRAKLKLKVFEKNYPGGQGVLTDRIDNFPGFNTISGAELMYKINNQVENLGTNIEIEEIVKITKSDDKYVINTIQNDFQSKNVIIATGAIPKRINVPGEKKFTGNGVSYCGTCDGALFADKDVAVIGGGNTALEEALYISKFAKKLSLIHRRDSLRGLKILEDEVRKIDKIDFILRSELSKIQGNEKVENIVIKDLKTEKVYSMKIDGVFIFVGYEPQTEFVKDFIDIDESGYIITNENLETSLNGIYAAGDVRKNPLKQLVTAAGEGAVAACSVIKKITGYY